MIRECIGKENGGLCDQEEATLHIGTSPSPEVERGKDGKSEEVLTDMNCA